MSDEQAADAPWIDGESRRAVEDFWAVYDAHYDEIVGRTLGAARQHAEFGPVLRAMAPEQIQAENRDSRERLRRAIGGEWAPYEASLRVQGKTYAKMGISFAGWYDLVRAFQHDLVPLLVRAYGNDPGRLSAALASMVHFVDRAMMVIGQEYLNTKEELIAEQRAIVQDTEKRYQLLFDRNPVPMWVYDRETLAFLAVNRAAIDHYGFTEAEFLGMTIKEIRFPEDIPMLMAEHQRLKNDSVPTDIGVWRHRKKDGTAILVELRLQDFTFSGRRAHLVVANDVTEHRKAEKALAESEERYRSLVAATTSIVWTVDAEGRFLVPQTSWESYTGQGWDRHAGFGWKGALHPADRERVWAAWELARAAQRLFEAEGRLWNAATAQYRFFVARAVPLVNPDGSLREWIGTVTDVDEQKKTEQPGRFFTLSLDLLCIAGIDGYFKRLNPAFKILGYSEEELLSTPFLDFVHVDDRPSTIAAVEKLGRGEPITHFENRYRCKDGSYRDLLWTSAADPSGLIYAAARDITDRKRIESERVELNRLLTQQNEELARASRAKSDFLNMMSHELRTPLNSIIGFSEVLIDGKFGPLTEKQTRYLRNVHQSGRHLLGLINDLLDLSKIEAGRLDVVRQPCAPRTLAMEAAATLQPIADARQIRIVLDPPGTPAIPIVSADAVRFKQVLYNLLSNAIKFSPMGGVVTASCALSPGREYVRTTVSDTGTGIAPEDLSRLFTPFTQLGNSKEHGGTGLGLALTKQLVELMGGHIGVNSTLGSGSAFFVDLPIETGASPIKASPTAVIGPAGGPMALIVDDDPDAQELLALGLQSAGFRTLAVATGEDAIPAARRYHPDVITLDVFLPTVDGWDVLRIVKNDPEIASIPVVMVTISADRNQAFNLGALEHLVKPIDQRTLVETLARRSFTTKVKQRPLHVLVVDDDVRQLELVGAALEPHGFSVRTESTGRGGVEAALAGPTDLLLLDLVMPDISGIEVVAALRSDHRTAALPIILITAHDLSPAQRARLNGDVEAVIAKGALQMPELVAEISSVLRRRA